MYFKRIILEYLSPRANFIIATVLVISGILGVFFKFFKWLRLKFYTKNLIKELPFYTAEEISKAVKYYAQTHCQSVSPSITHEPSQPYSFVPKEKLIPFFIKKAFESKDGDFKYYMLLADSGMGKTTLMLNLYLTYKKSLRKPFREFFNEGYKIKLIPLGTPEALVEINSIEEGDRSSTILLLDALDEDNEAIKDSKKRLQVLTSATKKFRKVIITARTQFFRSEEDEPHKVGIMKFGGDKGEHIFVKLYVSPFDNNDIKNF